MTIKQTMDRWARDYLFDSGIPDDAEFSFEDNISHGCETCGPDYYVQVQAAWYAPNAAGARRRNYRTREWSGTFGSLIEEISQWEEEDDRQDS